MVIASSFSSFILGNVGPCLLSLDFCPVACPFSLRFRILFMCSLLVYALGEKGGKGDYGARRLGKERTQTQRHKRTRQTAEKATRLSQRESHKGKEPKTTQKTRKEGV